MFQAKLGWLKGNIYSRVATPDIEERTIDSAEIKNGFYDNYVPKDKLVWLSGLQAELLRKLVKGKSAELGRELATSEVLDLIEKEIPEDIQIIANKIVDRFKKNGLIEEGEDGTAAKFARVIANEPSFKSLVKSFSD